MDPRIGASGALDQVMSSPVLIAQAVSVQAIVRPQDPVLGWPVIIIILHHHVTLTLITVHKSELLTEQLSPILSPALVPAVRGFLTAKHNNNQIVIGENLKQNAFIVGNFIVFFNAPFLYKIIVIS